ncbi:MAG: hypothetical protein ACU0BS_10975 [Hasllibacter sp.]
MRFTKTGALIWGALGAVIGWALVRYAIQPAEGAEGWALAGAAIGAGLAVLDLYVLSKFMKAKGARR